MSLKIRIDNIVANPKQPRTVFDEAKLEELARSIDENGLLHPILVEDNLDTTYTLIAGERRLRACKLLKRETIEAEVRAATDHNGRERLIHALVENIQREDMNPIDEAKAYRSMQDDYRLTQAEISQVTGKHTAHINHMLMLLKLDEPIQDMIAKGTFSKDSNLVREMLRIPDDKARLRLAQIIADKKMTVVAAKMAAVRMKETLKAKSFDENTTPVMEIVSDKTGQEVSRTHEPARWGALQQLGVVPAWGLIAKTASDTCAACPLRSAASPATCNPCALVDHLRRLVDAAK